MIWKDVKPNDLLKSAMSEDKPLAAKCFATLCYEPSSHLVGSFLVAKISDISFTDIETQVTNVVLPLKHFLRWKCFVY